MKPVTTNTIYRVGPVKVEQPKAATPLVLDWKEKPWVTLTAENGVKVTLEFWPRHLTPTCRHCGHAVYWHRQSNPTPGCLMGVAKPVGSWTRTGEKPCACPGFEKVEKRWEHTPETPVRFRGLVNITVCNDPRYSKRTQQRARVRLYETTLGGIFALAREGKPLALLPRRQYAHAATTIPPFEMQRLALAIEVALERGEWGIEAVEGKDSDADVALLNQMRLEGT